MRSCILVLTVFALSCLVSCGSAREGAAEPPAPRTTLYDADAEHLWNRLYSALYFRTTADGKVYGADELEPLLYPESSYLLTGKRHKEVLALLDEFLARDGAKLIKDPLKRAVFQHDLWAIFDWSAEPDAADVPATAHLTAERRALQTRLARILRALAPSAEQVAQLPDTYAAAVAAGTFARAYDPDKADKPFLPPDLFEAHGPWVMLAENPGRLATPAHVQAFGGRSAFFAFLNMPKGRMATLEYLKQLRKFPNPLMPRPANGSGILLNPDLPQFPVGTQAALVRELVLIDDKGNLTPTRILEEVQFRVYRDAPRGDNTKMSKQDFYEFRMSRSGLFAEKAGGLRAEGADGTAFGRLNREFYDPFEQPDHTPRPSPILQQCVGCHGVQEGPGIHSVQSYRHGFSSGGERPADLIASERRTQEDAAARWKRGQYNWGVLEGLRNDRR
jgi:hypothetical protein